MELSPGALINTWLLAGDIFYCDKNISTDRTQLTVLNWLFFFPKKISCPFNDTFRVLMGHHHIIFEQESEILKFNVFHDYSPIRNLIYMPLQCSLCSNGIEDGEKWLPQSGAEWGGSEQFKSIKEAVLWLRLCTSNTRGAGSVPGQGTKVPQAVPKYIYKMQMKSIVHEGDWCPRSGTWDHSLQWSGDNTLTPLNELRHFNHF